ncbi:MAG: hypothetical protein Q9217_005847 [Psora testacea]
MPTLKHITCTVEWASSNIPLQEYLTTYADGYVETYIVVPPLPTPFCVHLRSRGYIAPGLAMFVYIDGVYQCNRNRHNLKVPAETTSRRQSEVSFRVRQKEERRSDGTFEGKSWKFEKVKIASVAASGPTIEEKQCAPHDGEYIGIIEVVVLRCYPSDAPTPPIDAVGKPPPKKIPVDEDVPPLMGAMFDGANDTKPGLFSLCGSSELSSSNGRWLKQKSNKEKIEIHNSNVRIYNAASQDSEPARTSYHRRRRAFRQTSDDYYYSDRTSPRAHMRSCHGESHKHRTPSPNSQGPPVLQLRGGAPGSYTASPIAAGWNWDNVPASESGKQNATSNKAPSLKNTSAMGPSAIENKDWKANPSDWGVPSSEAKLTARSPIMDPAQRRDPWGALNTDHRDNNGDENSGWDSMAHSYQKRDVLGQLITEERPIDDAGTSDCNAPCRNHAREDNCWNMGNNMCWRKGGANQQDSALGNFTLDMGNQQQNAGYDTSGRDKDKQTRLWKANTANGTEQGRCWSSSNNQGRNRDAACSTFGTVIPNNDCGCKTSRDSNKRCKSWEPPKADQTKPTFGAITTVEDQKLKDPQARNTNGDTKPWLSFGNNGAKSAKTASVAPRAKSSLSPLLSSTLRRAGNNMRTPLPDNLDEDKSATIPGAWSPPLRSLKEKEPVPEREELKAPAPEHTVPTSSAPKARKVKPYWSFWNTSGQPLEDENLSDREATNPMTQDDEPIYTIPSTVAARTSVTHQVRPMRGSSYSHKLSTPKYLDTHDDPYAVFVFKYRDKAVVEGMIGETLEEAEAEEKTRLAGLSKEEIIETLMKAKADKDGGGHLASTGGRASWTAPSGSTGNASGSSSSNADIGSARGWGQNPKGAGPWTSIETATSGNLGATDWKDSAGNKDKEGGGNGWGGDDTNNGGGGGLGSSENNKVQENSWGNDTAEEGNYENGHADNSWGGNGDYNDRGDGRDHDSHSGGDEWNNNTLHNGGGGGGWTGNGEFTKDDGRDTRWGASDRGRGEKSW